MTSDTAHDVPLFFGFVSLGDIYIYVPNAMKSSQMRTEYLSKLMGDGLLMVMKNRLANWNLTNIELEQRIYEFLCSNHGEPSNTNEVEKELSTQGLRISIQRIPYIVKDSFRIKHKLLRVKSCYGMLVFWV